MHKAVEAVEAVKAAKAVNETDQNRMDRLKTAAEQELNKHKSDSTFEKVEQALKQSGYACDTFEQMQSLFAPAGLAIALSDTNDSIADYIRLCIQINPDEMQEDLSSLEGKQGLGGFNPESKGGDTLYLAGFAKGSRMLNHIPYGIKELNELLAPYITLAHTLDEQLSGDAADQLLASGLVPLVLKTAFYAAVNFLNNKFTDDEIGKYWATINIADERQLWLPVIRN